MKEIGKVDTITKEYIRNPVIFADVFNKFVYHGRQVVKPENLRELDNSEIALPYGNDTSVVPEQKYRDVLKLLMTDGEKAYCILGIEDQTDIHYAMPVKNGLYDFLQLSHQVSETAKAHRSNKDKASSAEYLSGFHKTDKLLPVLTLVIYWGADAWDGPLSLKEMYSLTDEEFMKYLPDYKVNLIAPNQMSEEEIGEFHTALKEIMLFIKYSNDKQKLEEITNKDEKFKHLECDAVDVLNIVTNSNMKYDSKKEAVDVCVAMKEIREEGVEIGRIEGREEGVEIGRMEGVEIGRIEGAVKMCREFGASFDDTVAKIMKKFNISAEKAEEMVKQYWEE